MPTETWGNLPEEKRRRVTEAAMREFGSKGFSAGSLNVIAREAGIAKGSLFQYFADKRDMFETISEALSASIAAGTVGVVDGDQPIFAMLRELVVHWLDYHRTHPVEQRMAFATANEIDDESRVTVRGVTNERYAAVLRPIVERALDKGELRPGTDVDLFVSMVTLVMRHLNTAPFDAVGDPMFAFHDLADEQVDAIALAYVDALERGFGPESVRG